MKHKNFKATHTPDSYLDDQNFCDELHVDKKQLKIYT